MLKKICRLIVLLICLTAAPLCVQAAPATPDTGINAADMNSALDAEKVRLHGEIMQMLQNEQQKKELQDYLIATRPIIEQYQEYFNTASRFAIWSEENIPIIGHLLSNVTMSIVNHFYQNALQEVAQTEVAQKFAELRSYGINIDLNIFQQAIADYLLKQGVDLSLVLDLQQLLNQKSEVHDFMQSIIKSSGAEFMPIDEGDILPKMPDI
ncbi:Uncharacterised protein [Megamonas hypermegale]|uniref:Uncharacterized protein n=1 Tax=Megamonas hypermegale TaxID=158847 RepID=A0A239TGX0_9FIRM|nr:hypothetical protein [Megamonas hypermegale]SNU96856.1 Uncharacterised protein [Megamonas hypermegale]